MPGLPSSTSSKRISPMPWRFSEWFQNWISRRSSRRRVAKRPRSVQFVLESLESRYLMNTAPILDPLINQSVNQGSMMSFMATAHDNETPSSSLMYSLDPGAPSGASITPSGTFSWTPTSAQAPGNYTIFVRVLDDGMPALSDAKGFTATVNFVNH